MKFDSLEDYFCDYLFPLAIEIGMTSEEFWKDDPRLFSSYMKAYEEKRKREYETINYSNWLQGLYNFDGSNKALTSFGYGFLAGKENPNKESYPSKPYDLFGKEKENKIKERQKMRELSQKTLNFWASIKK